MKKSFPLLKSHNSHCYFHFKVTVNIEALVLLKATVCSPSPWTYILKWDPLSLLPCPYPDK